MLTSGSLWPLLRARVGGWGEGAGKGKGGKRLGRADSCLEFCASRLRRGSINKGHMETRRGTSRQEGSNNRDTKVYPAQQE